MPIDYKKTLLLGDRDSERAALLIDVIKNDFSTEVIRVEFLDEVDAKVLEAVRASKIWKVVLLATDLEESATNQEPILPKDFYHIAKNNYSRVGSVYTETEPPDPEAVGHYLPSIYVPAARAKRRRQLVIDSIVKARIGGLKLWKKPKIILDPDPVFVE